MPAAIAAVFFSSSQLPTPVQFDSHQLLNIMQSRSLNIYEQESCSETDKIFMCFHGALVSIQTSQGVFLRHLHNHEVLR